MYQYTFDEDTTKEIEEKNKKSKTIMQQFEDVDNKYNTLTSSDSNLDLERLEYSKPSDSDIKNKAESSLMDYKNSKISSINDNFDAKTENIDQSIEKIKKSEEKDKEEIYQTYQGLKQDAKDDAVKRGLARSSIIVNTLSNYDNGMVNKLLEKSNEISAKISSYENERNLLEEQKQNALSSFDIEYAVKLQEKIDEINSDILAREEEVTKYNNEISELEAKWKKEQEDDNFDKTTELAKLMGEYGTAVFDVLKQNEKYAIARQYLNSMAKDEALIEFKNNSAYYTNLGKYNYNKLLDELNAR